MERQELENKIRAFLEEDSPEYFKGVELYEQHPEAKKNLMINFRQRYNKGSMHEKLVYELEKMVGAAVYSNKRTVLEHNPANIPYKLIEKTKVEAPVNYEYKVKYENLPEDLKKKVIQKGQLYYQLENLKDQLAKIGQKNDEGSIDLRQPIMQQMHKTVDTIKEIHAELMQYDEKGIVIAKPEIETVKKDIPISENADYIDVELENEFAYMQMSYYQLKDLLVKLRSSVVKQEQRIQENINPKLKNKNIEKAKLGRKMIALLVKYFEENKEA